MRADRAEKLWQRAVLWPVRHAAATLAVAALAALLAALGTCRIRPDASLEGMFSEKDPAARALLRVLNHFGAAEEMLLLVSLPPGPGEQPPDTARLLGFAARLDEAVRNSPEAAGLCDRLLYRADPDLQRFVEQVLVPGGLFYLNDEEFLAARQRLTLDGMREQIARNESMVAAPGPAAQAIAKATLQDPLRLHEFLLSRLAAQRPFPTYQNGDAFICQDGRSLLIRIVGKRPPSDLDFARQLTAAMRTLVDRINSDRLVVEYSGAYPIAAASERSIRGDMISSITSSIICLQLLFVLAYRRPVRLMALAFTPVLLGVLFGFGAYSLFGSSLTPLTAAVGAILSGLAIDYSIHVLAHYEAERLAGRAPQEAAEHTLLSIAPALLAAWLTSVIGFLALGSSSVPAIRGFAVLGSLGLAGAVLAAGTVLPALLVLLDRRPAEQVRQRRQARFGTGGMLRVVARHRWLSLGLSTALLLACVGILTASAEGLLPLESDLAVMHPRPNPPLEAQAHIAERFGVPMDWLILHLEAASPQDLVALAHRAQDRLTGGSLKAAGQISGAIGLGGLLPDPRRVPGRLAAISPGEAQQVADRFRSAIAESSFDPAVYEPYAQFLHHLVSQRTAPGVPELLAYPGLARVVLPRRVLADAAPATEAITLLYLRQPLRNRAEREAAVGAIRTAVADLPGVTLTGMSVIARDTEEQVRRDLPKLLLLASLAVGGYLLVHFRSLGKCALSMLPTAASFIILLAMMRLAGQRLNLVNLVAIPLLIGLDVDYGIFLVSLAGPGRSRSEDDLLGRLEASCAAILMCAATTVLGFGSLYFTSVPAIQSLGFAAGVGVIACFACTFFVLLPLLIVLARAPSRLTQADQTPVLRP